MRVAVCLSILVALVWLGGCSGNGATATAPPAPQTSAAGPARADGARTLDFPSGAPALPQGEPAGSGELAWIVPESWTVENT